VDSWLLLRNIEQDGERNRALFVLKSRGMAHSNQLREFVMTNHGIDLLDVYVGSQGVLTGSARALQEARDESSKVAKQEDVERRQRVLERKRHALESQIAALRSEFETEEENLKQIIEADQDREQSMTDSRTDAGCRRRSLQRDAGDRWNDGAQ
jgi:circadian clock protein KaiC